MTITAHNGIGQDATQPFVLTVDQPAALTSADAATFTVGSAGLFAVQSTGYPLPALSTSGTLPVGVTFTDNGDGTASLAGTPVANSGGSYRFTITAHNGVGTDGAQSFTLVVDQRTSIGSAASATFTAGSAGSFTVQASGYPTPTLSEIGSLPAGVSFTDNGDGTASLAGTPNPTAGGSYVFTITAGNELASPASQTFTLVVDQAPAITSAAQATVTAGTRATITVQATGYPAPALSVVGNLPAGLTFADRGDGSATLAGTPTTGGAYTFTIAAHNGVGADAGQTFALTVDQRPAISTAASATYTAGSAGSFTIGAAGFPVPTLSEVGSLPAGLTFTDNGDGTAGIRGTPASGTGGSYTFTVAAHNGIGSDATQRFTLTVDEAPSITSAAAATYSVGAAAAFTVTCSHAYPAVTLSETGSLPSGVSFTNNGNGTARISGAPAAGSGGVYTLAVTAQNGVGTPATQTFTLTVNEAPGIISGPTATLIAGQPNRVTVAEYGWPRPALTWLGTLPLGVSFTDNGDGTATLVGMPEPSTGVYPLLITAGDNGAGSAVVQTFMLTVAEPPPFISAAATLTVGQAGSFTVGTVAGLPTPMVVREQGACRAASRSSLPAARRGSSACPNREPAVSTH